MLLKFGFLSIYIAMSTRINLLFEIKLLTLVKEFQSIVSHYTNLLIDIFENTYVKLRLTIAYYTSRERLFNFDKRSKERS